MTGVAGTPEGLLLAACGSLLIAVVLWEGFETIVLPRRVTRRFRLTRLFYRSTWRGWRKLVVSVIPERRRETWLSIYGPFSLVLLLTLWAAGLVTGFGLLQHAFGSTFLTHGEYSGLRTDLYLSSTTFFTLGLGDALPGNAAGRILVIIESGMGFGFLALIIAYFPAINQSFSRREVSISLLDARAGSPPTACGMLGRHGYRHGMEALRQLLYEWERWSADFMEGHLSYPVLAYFRSQHDNQSWLGALTAILDTCALVITGVEGACERQAELTFAMARHALVDLSLVFDTMPRLPEVDRLPPEKMARLVADLAAAGIRLREEGGEQRLAELRRMYEPYVEGLAGYFHLAVPPWLPVENQVDNWQASKWDDRAIRRRPSDFRKGEHF